LIAILRLAAKPVRQPEGWGGDATGTVLDRSPLYGWRGGADAGTYQPANGWQRFVLFGLS
jgi:hypothetical protein